MGFGWLGSYLGNFAFNSGGISILANSRVTRNMRGYCRKKAFNEISAGSVMAKCAKLKKNIFPFFKSSYLLCMPAYA